MRTGLWIACLCGGALSGAAAWIGWRHPERWARSSAPQSGEITIRQRDWWVALGLITLWVGLAIVGAP